MCEQPSDQRGEAEVESFHRAGADPKLPKACESPELDCGQVAVGHARVTASELNHYKNNMPTESARGHVEYHQSFVVDQFGEDSVSSESGSRTALNRGTSATQLVETTEPRPLALRHQMQQQLRQRAARMRLR